MNHELKILPCYYQEIIDGNKTFEIRNNDDRGFQKGDIITLREYEFSRSYSGRECKVQITYVTNYKQKEGFIVFGFNKIPKLT